MAEKEYIERDKAIDACFYGWNNNAHDCAENIRSIPAADVRPVRHGKWSQTGYDHGLKVCECSVCKKRAYGSTKFCPNCGADMREE